MQIGLSTLNEIGTNYYIKLNDKEVLVVEEDPLRKQKKNSTSKNIEKELELQKKEKAKNPKSIDDLSEDEKKLVNDLIARDAEVKTHEAAHQAAGGGMTGGASYTYQQGPDGKMYAIGGEVPISMHGGSTPEETIENAKRVEAAAMAPANPSGQDFAVASSAKMMQMKAQQQLTKEKEEKILGTDNYKQDKISYKDKVIKPFDISA